MAVDNTYEEVRNQRLQENKKRFEDLGILNLTKSLSILANSEKKSKQGSPKPKPKATNSAIVEPRRSSRARNPVSYRYDLDIELPTSRKRLRTSSAASGSWERYCQRPIEEVRLASYEERTSALKAAEEFRSNLQSGNPSFVKSMVRSHVYSCFWLGLPTQFCKNHMPKKDLDMTLEDEDGSEYDAKYLGHKTGLSGGWRGFALHKKLDDGDAVVFELVETERFKIYIFKVSSSLSSQNHKAKGVEREGSGATSSELEEATEPAKKTRKAEVDENGEVSNKQQQTRKKNVGKKKTGNISSKRKSHLKHENHEDKDATANDKEAKLQVEKDRSEKGRRRSKPRKAKLLRRA